MMKVSIDTALLLALRLSLIGCVTDESYMVCHKGYLSLFPFLLELLPPSAPQLGHILDLMRDPEHLWSPYGIRSLSKSHPEFGQGENYWKGPIWIQMNYLALRALHRVCIKLIF
jgi:mannosyl-oligosaccharide glucosidase